jgi:hypothetical protein
MSGILINLIIQAIAGAVGGNAAGAASSDMSLGTFGNTIAGAIGSGAGGQLLAVFIPMLAQTASTTDIGALAGQVAGGGVAGAVLTGVIALIKSKMA